MRFSFRDIVMPALALLAIGAPVFAQPIGEPGVPGAAASGGLLEAVLFYLVAGAVCVPAVGVCVSKNIVRMATWLFIALGMIAVLYFLLAAYFVGAIQLIVYAGGTLILIVFGVMLTSKSPWVKWDAPKRELIAAGVVSLVLLVSLVLVVRGSVFSGSGDATNAASVADLGRKLLTVYLVPFEVAGVLLMIVMVGAAHLARQSK